MSQQPGERDILLLGSVPLETPGDVFRTVGAALGDGIRRIPDGETGDRRNWINYQYAYLAAHPQLEFAGDAVDPANFVNESSGKGADYDMPTPLKVKDGVAPEELSFGPLGYADNALASYAEFRRLKDEGAVPSDCRFQVSLPTPLAVVGVFIAPDHNPAVYPAYEAALFGELDRIAAGIPHGELAVQWDVAVEFGLWEGAFPRPPGDWKAMILGQLATLGERVPAGVELGYHLCYGDRGHKHFVEPKDTGNLVEVANGLSAMVTRTIEWIHLPVPRDRSDADYFKPLGGLQLKPETRLYLGLVHHTDGVDGTRRRIEAASAVVADFGIATECGMGRRAPDTIPDLLRVHTEAARA